MKITKEEILVGVVLGLVTYLAISTISKKTRKNSVNNIKGINNNPKKILIVGDSQSAIQNASGDKITYTYPNILREKLKDKGVTIDVLAIGGKTTKWMLENLPNQLSNNKYCKKHIDSNKGDFNNSSINLKSNIIIECEYITINDIEYIYNINNNLLFNNNLYSPDCIGIYLNNIIHYYTD